MEITDPHKTMNNTEAAFVNACLEHGASVTICGRHVTVMNPQTGASHDACRLANTQTFDMPSRAAEAVCKRLGMEDGERFRAEERAALASRLTDLLMPFAGETKDEDAAECLERLLDELRAARRKIAAWEPVRQYLASEVVPCSGPFDDLWELQKLWREAYPDDAVYIRPSETS